MLNEQEIGWTISKWEGIKRDLDAAGLLHRVSDQSTQNFYVLVYRTEEEGMKSQYHGVGDECFSPPWAFSKLDELSEFLFGYRCALKKGKSDES